MSVVDAWMQHPALRHSQHEMFESLRRWTGRGLPEEQLPVAVTVSALEAARRVFAL
jgi:hypothetical protein